MTQTQPHIPPPAVLWKSFRSWTWALFALVGLNAVPELYVQYWFNRSLGFRTIFWTNLQMQLVLLVAYGTVLTLAVYAPVRLYSKSRTFRSAALHVGLWIGIVGGWILAGGYRQFLLALNGVPFGKADPIFGADIGFYVYVLPAWRALLTAVASAIAISAIFCLAARWEQLDSKQGLAESRGLEVTGRLGAFAVPYLRALAVLAGLVAAVHAYLGRYELLFKDNEAAGVRTGAAYVDVEGIISHLSAAYVSAAVALGVALAVSIILARLHKRYQTTTLDESSRDNGRASAAVPSIRRPAWTAAALVVLQIGFPLAVIVRNYVFVQPNEPTIQSPYIERHIEATNRAYQLDSVEVREWTPPQQALSTADLMASETVRNAPLVAPWVSYLEEPPDIQHYERIAVSDSKMVFGPVLQTYEQQQQLRPYYKFLSVDGVRYTLDGRKRMFASAVRELPSLALVGEREWLKYWGSSALQFTHGMGLVMSPVNQVDEVGGATYVVDEVPPRTSHEALRHEPRVYFGEGAKDEYILTNVNYLNEFDYATDQDRAEFRFPDDLIDGIPVDSLWKRLVFAAHTKDVTAFLFSRYIDPSRTRIHIRRTPISRIQSLAPFLFLDTNSYAFIADGHVLWMVNGLTTSDQYPYSFREVLGDKSDERAVERFPERIVNYAEDSVKVTINAYSGDVRFYKIADDPIVNTWERIYPDLFTPGAAMPGDVGAQLTYPQQWLHIQFDDIYKRYHQRDPIEFYNVEDLWDDADDTLGSIGRGLSGYGSSDQMTFSYEAYNALLDPADMPSDVTIGEPGDLQFAKLMPFTPEGARNLRTLIVALQDPGQYGRLISLQIPQGMFVPGPEQIDAYIDNDRPVHQQVTMWIRHSSEVIRGRTLLLPVRGDLMYVETIWVNSLQNELPQLKLVAARYRDRITSGSTLEAALRKRQWHEPRPDVMLAEEVENRQGDGDRRDGDQGADENETADADVQTLPAKHLEPQQTGE